jgi:hypothetical protein
VRRATERGALAIYRTLLRQRRTAQRHIASKVLRAGAKK